MPNYTYVFWNDTQLRDFIEREHGWFRDTYDGYKYHIQRVDVAKYFIMYSYGGIYSDLDIWCERPIHEWLNKGYGVLLPLSREWSFSNDFMVSSKKHPFFKWVIDALIGVYQDCQLIF